MCSHSPSADLGTDSPATTILTAAWVGVPSADPNTAPPSPVTSPKRHRSLPCSGRSSPVKVPNMAVTLVFHARSCRLFRRHGGLLQRCCPSTSVRRTVGVCGREAAAQRLSGSSVGGARGRLQSANPSVHCSALIITIIIIMITLYCCTDSLSLPSV